MINWQAWGLTGNEQILVITACLFGISALTRLGPFCMQSFFQRSELINQVGNYLPSAIMLLLIFHTLDDVHYNQAPFGLPEIGCTLLAALLYVWRRQLILALAVSTIVYLIIENFLLK